MSERPSSSWARLPGVRVGAVLAIALAAGFIVWLVVRGNDKSSRQSAGPVATTPAELRALSVEVGHPL